MEALILSGQPEKGGLSGKVVNVGIAANPATGKIPVLGSGWRTQDEKLRCYIDVKVRLGDAAKGDKKP